MIILSLSNILGLRGFHHVMIQKLILSIPQPVKVAVQVLHIYMIGAVSFQKKVSWTVCALGASLLLRLQRLAMKIGGGMIIISIITLIGIHLFKRRKTTSGIRL